MGSLHSHCGSCLKEADDRSCGKLSSYYIVEHYCCMNPFLLQVWQKWISQQRNEKSVKTVMSWGHETFQKTCEMLETALNKAFANIYIASVLKFWNEGIVLIWFQFTTTFCTAYFPFSLEFSYWLGSWQARISALRHKLPFQLWGRMRM